MKVAPLIIFLTGIYLAEGNPTTNPKDLEASGFKLIFDGKTLKGWDGNLDYFRIEVGAIVAGNLEKKIPNNEFLVTKSNYEDFELHFEARLIGKGNNAGVQFWSQRIPNHHEMIGFQCDIGGWSKGSIWGFLYDESRRRKMLAEVPQNELAQHTLSLIHI